MKIVALAMALALAGCAYHKPQLYWSNVNQRGEECGLASTDPQHYVCIEDSHYPGWMRAVSTDKAFKGMNCIGACAQLGDTLRPRPIRWPASMSVVCREQLERYGWLINDKERPEAYCENHLYFGLDDKP